MWFRQWSATLPLFLRRQRPRYHRHQPHHRTGFRFAHGWWRSRYKKHRQTLTAATVGTGNSLVSLLEDIISTITSILAIFFPVMMIVFVMIIVIIVYRRFRKRSSVRFQPIE